jgi:hypothetical protein
VTVRLSFLWVGGKGVGEQFFKFPIFDGGPKVAQGSVLRRAVAAGISGAVCTWRNRGSKMVTFCYQKSRVIFEVRNFPQSGLGLGTTDARKLRRHVHPVSRCCSVGLRWTALSNFCSESVIARQFFIGDEKSYFLSHISLTPL